MSKLIQFDVEARRKLKEGMDALARSVVITLGLKVIPGALAERIDDRCPSCNGHRCSSRLFPSP